jgi:CheY-like chemotaxis protein
MIQPLALVLYERLLPGGQLVNRLQDKGYRVQVLAEPAQLVEQAERDKPLVVLADLEPHSNLVCQAIGTLKQRNATAHLPVIAFSGAENAPAQEAARAAGAKLVVHDTAILVHLDHFLEQALQLD